MATLNICITQVEGEPATVKLEFTNDVGVDVMVESVNRLFEIEMYSSVINTGKTTTTIIFEVDNEEKVERLKSGMGRVFRERSGLGEVNYN